MAKLKDVINFFIAISNARAKDGLGDDMTNLRLQKMLYFAQGSSLARNGKPLFENAIEAWEYGPVVPTAYHYCKNGRDTLTADMPSMQAFTEEEIELLTDVYSEYDQYSTSKLVSMTHEADTPWSSTRKNKGNTVISCDEIKKYFVNHPLKTFKERSSRIPVSEPIRYDDGIPVFSAEEESDYD